MEKKGYMVSRASKYVFSGLTGVVSGVCVGTEVDVLITDGGTEVGAELSDTATTEEVDVETDILGTAVG